VADPRISVVVPTRGRPAALLDCVNALRGQEHPDGGFEIVIVDDGDGVPALTEEVRVVAGEGTGPAAARNRGIDAARGEIIAFTDDDCRPSSRWLRELDAELRRGRAAGVAGSTVNGVAQDVFAAASQLVLDATHEHFSRGGEPRFAASCNLAVLAADIRALGGFDRSFRYAEDRDLCARWLASGRRLAWAPGAKVVHCRDMNLARFLRQHFAYGRGAYAVHRRAGSGILPRPQPSFVLALARQVRRAPRGRLRLAALCALSQVAYAAGYVIEAATSGSGR
jgi:glycosyltransferase involved in cell wall biosynthesis